MTARLRVLAVGPQVSIQNAGRPGLMRFGVPHSGPMDRASFAIAQAALGQSHDAPVIEVSRGGLCLECLAGPISLSIAGGGFVGSWQVLTLSAGDRLDIRPGPWGSWCYIAFAGDLRAKDWLGSTATHALSNLGGGALQPGQILSIEAPETHPNRAIPCPVWARPRRSLRAIAGPQDRFFSAQALQDLTQARFQLSDAYDRMGIRLRGPSLAPTDALQIPSEPVLRGSVQVAGDGAATILLADHQTTGGYPKIATVIDTDLDAFAQCRPHQTVTFTLVTPDAAIALIRQQHTKIARLLERLKPPTGQYRPTA
jgi:biotin-dependent carboxylase-like uncharacterized protein